MGGKWAANGRQMGGKWAGTPVLFSLFFHSTNQYQNKLLLFTFKS
jgi:hypothetical protein